MFVKRFLLVAIVQLWLAACIPVQRTELPRIELDCNSMLAAPMNTLVGQEVGQQQLIRMIEEAYSIPEDQLEVHNFRDYEFWTGGDVWEVQWDKLGVNYEVSVEDNITYRIDVRYQEQSAPSAKRIVECLGEVPQHYIAVYQVEVPATGLNSS